MFPYTIEVNGTDREIRCLQLDPVNNEHTINVDGAVEDPFEFENDESGELNDSFFNSAKEYPGNVIGATLDPLSGSYRYITDTESESSPDCVSLSSAYTDDTVEEGKRKKRSFNKRILLTVERIDAKVNEFRAELGNQLKSLIDENVRRRGWQERVNMVLSMLATDLAN